MTDTTYIGNSDPRKGEYEVSCCNGVTSTPLPLCLDNVQHSPTGFAWGYGGSGPAQLAFALLFDAIGIEHVARKWYMRYKAEVVSALPDSWQMTITQVRRWVLRKQQEEAMGPRPNPLQPIFRDHNCGGCDSGAKPCREGNYNSCSWPRARDD